MKRMLLLLFSLVLLLSLPLSNGCTHAPDSPEEETTIDQKTLDGITSECVHYEDGAYVLVLPASQNRLRVDSYYYAHLTDVDDEMVAQAEKRILARGQDPKRFSVEMYDNSLCLVMENIVDIDPPLVQTTENGETIANGCGIDHKHVFFAEKITK